MKLDQAVCCILAIVSFASLTAGQPIREPVDQDQIGAVRRFVNRIPHGVGRYWNDGQAATVSSLQVDPERVAAAVRNSAAWIRAVLTPEFVPLELESHIEALPGGLGPMDRDGVIGRGPRYDATKATLEFDQTRLVVVQDSFSIRFFVLSLEPEGLTVERTPDDLVDFLRSRLRTLFRHVPASFFLRAVRLTEFGVELTTSSQVWDMEQERWKSTVLVPPQVCVERLVNPMSHPEFGEAADIGARMRELDPTLPATLRDQDLPQYWWGSVYAATDGRVLVYSVGKTSPGQSNTTVVPDWFRISDDEELDGGGSKAGQTRSRMVAEPPKE